MPYAAAAATPPAGRLWNVLSPTTDPRDPLLLSNLFATLPSSGPVALEFAAEAERLHLLARAWDAPTGQALSECLYAALPQARLVPVADDDDPARPTPGLVSRAVELTLREAEIYSLRTYQRPALDGEGDPLAVLVRSLQGLPPGERCLLRLTLAPAPANWQRRYRRYQKDVELAPARRGWPTSASESIATHSSSLFLIMMVAGLILLLGYRLLMRSPLLAALQALPTPLLIGLGLLSSSLLLLTVYGLSWLGQRLLAPRGLIPNQPLLMSKLGATGCLARLHLWCWGPTLDRVDQRLARISAALRQYDRADGNGLVARPYRHPPAVGPVRLTRRYLHLFGRAPVLSIGELCSLWGPVGGLTDAGDLTRAGAVRRRPPRFGPDGRPWLDDGCPIGHSEQGGISRPIAYPRALLQRVTAIFGSTGSGKSNLLSTLIVAAMADSRHTVVVFDTHSRLVRTVLGQVPAERQADMILIDLGDPDHSVGLNLLDVTVGQSPERIVADTISCLARLWPDTWGPRMEQMLRGALITLVDANRQRAPEEQFTLFHVVDLLLNPTFRQRLRQRYDPHGKHDTFWQTYFASRSANIREEMINPVLTKIFQLFDMPATRRLLGQPRSTIDLSRAVLEHKIILVDLAQGVAGEALAGIVGALIMAYVDQAIISQARLAPAALAAGTVFFDEFETMPAINYDRIIAQLRKYGFGFLFVTQSVETLAKRQPILLAQLRDNCQALIAFRTSAQAGLQLVDSFDGLVTPVDLANLETGSCYVKLEDRGRPVPAFWLQTLLAAPGDTTLANRLATASYRQYATPLATIEATLALQARRLVEFCTPPPKVTVAGAADTMATDQPPTASSLLAAPTTYPTVELSLDAAPTSATGLSRRERRRQRQDQANDQPPLSTTIEPAPG